MVSSVIVSLVSKPESLTIPDVLRSKAVPREPVIFKLNQAYFDVFGRFNDSETGNIHLWDSLQPRTHTAVLLMKGSYAPSLTFWSCYLGGGGFIIVPNPKDYDLVISYLSTPSIRSLNSSR